MRATQKIDPEFDYDTGATLWAAVTVVLLGLVVNFVLFEPGWLIPATLLAGGVAALRSGYYDPSGNSAALGVAVGGLVLAPILAFSRIALGFGTSGAGDVGFLTVALTLGTLAIIAITMIPVGYIGAVLTDHVLKRVGGPLGY